MGTILPNGTWGMLGIEMQVGAEDLTDSLTWKRSRRREAMK